MDVERTIKFMEEIVPILVETEAWIVGVGLHADDENCESHHLHVAVFHGHGAERIPSFYDGIPIRVLHVLKSQMSGDEIIDRCPICSKLPRRFAEVQIPIGRR